MSGDALKSSLQLYGDGRPFALQQGDPAMPMKSLLLKRTLRNHHHGVRGLALAALIGLMATAISAWRGGRQSRLVSAVRALECVHSDSQIPQSGAPPVVHGQPPAPRQRTTRYPAIKLPMAASCAMI
jgi:hypothetical protein